MPVRRIPTMRSEFCRVYIAVLMILLVLDFSGPAAANTNRLIVATPSPLDTLDPHMALDTVRADARHNLYDPLYRWIDSPLRVEPWLALSYTVSEDQRVFRFTLRKGALFHDGREVKASDVVYSVERMLALKRGIAPLLTGLVNPGSTKAIDPYTVEFSLTRPAPLFLTLLPELAIVNAEILKANELNNDWARGWLQTNSAGSGLFTLKSFTSPMDLGLERFALHWANSADPKAPGEVQVRALLDTEARVDAALKGEVHVLEGNLLPRDIRRLREAKDITTLETDAPRTFFGLMNANREPFKTAAGRKLIAQVFDIDSFIQSSLANGAQPLAIPLPPSLGTPPQGTQRTAYDPAAAAQALARLKLPPRELTIGAIAGDPHSERAALMMLDGLLRLGFQGRIQVEPWPQVAARLRDERQMYDILFMWIGARYLDAHNWAGEPYDCDLFGAGNASWYCNRDIDRQIKEARAIADPRLRRAAYEKVAQLLATDQASIFVAAQRRPVWHLKRVKGLKTSPVGEALDFRQLTLE